MTQATSIEWTDATWNPVRGCSKVSPGCTNCYAAAVASRFNGAGMPYEGLAYRDASGRPQWTGVVRVVEDHILDPLRARRPRKWFVNSMSDLFHESLDDQDIARVWGVMAACHAASRGHVFQVLTKRPYRMRALLSDEAFHATVAVYATEYLDPGRLQGSPPRLLDDLPDVLPNVWVGTSVENQETANERIPHLTGTPAAVRFLSCEPILGPVDITRIRANLTQRTPVPWYAPLQEQLQWVIVGGESGHGARPMDVEWVRGIVQACQSHGIAVFVKQLGSQWAKIHGGPSKGGDMVLWPEDLRVRQYPGAS